MRAIWVVEKKWQGRWYVWSTHHTTDAETGSSAARRYMHGMNPLLWRVVKYVPAPAKKPAKKRSAP